MDYDPRIIPGPASAHGAMSIERLLPEPSRDREAPFTATRFTLPPQGTSALDHHDERELWVVLSGEGTLSVNGKALSLGPGDAVYFPPRYSHQLRNDSAQPLVVLSVYWRDGG
jgi:mannose-6-phosphate isomerase-like protein (cupin superfamily)